MDLDVAIQRAKRLLSEEAILAVKGLANLDDQDFAAIDALIDFAESGGD